MIVCQCTGTTDRDIARLKADGVGTAAGVALATGGAGGNCAPCRREIKLLLASDDGEQVQSALNAA